MSPEKFALCVALAVFVGGAVGLFLQRILPEKFTTGGPRDMIGAVVGLLTLTWGSSRQAGLFRHWALSFGVWIRGVSPSFAMQP
jgi:hypothetical protein